MGAPARDRAAPLIDRTRDLKVRDLDDADPFETRDWLDSIDSVVRAAGPQRAAYLLQKTLEHARMRGVRADTFARTPYVNTIPVSAQPPYPGDLELEARITGLVRWNALAMVVRANREHAELGGHIATYSSVAELFEVGLNHFFRGGQSGDLVYWQPHAAPGVYARAFLEGRLSEERLGRYRRETTGDGLSSYCHPMLMPDFWQFPTGSMGLGPLTAVYQARFMRYLEDRKIAPTGGRKVWAFIGDGEMDEPESLAGLSLAARDQLDNLIFVVNCNLQRLDGPVRGNGSIIQELDTLFAGAGWNVIKVLWGSNWDTLFSRDREGAIARQLSLTVDGQLQTYAATDGRFNREQFFQKNPQLETLVHHLSDDEIDGLLRGGHDPIKIYAAYHAAANPDGRPTVILAQTKKGYGMGPWGQGKMTAHQQKKLRDDALLAYRDRFALPLSDEDVLGLRFYRPPDDSPEMEYLQRRRSGLGGYTPARSAAAPKISAPPLSAFARMLAGTGEREQSTTTAFVQMLQTLLRGEIAKSIVPIVADEARTFGMESLFRQVAIYSPLGQLYEPEDKDQLSYYREAQDGQILEEGITEAGAMSSWIAAATSYSAHGTPMLPFYIFYSMFGFQRIGDLIWAAADARARGFLLGATSGRTTLSGEGLQHQDGSSHLIASTIPTCRAFDPCFAYELAVILADGTRRILEAQEDVFYYLTLMNENYPQPAMPAGSEAGILRGMYRLRERANARVQLLGSGAILREVIGAAEILERAHGIAADVWSVTSWSELRWDGMRGEKENRPSFVAETLTGTAGPIVAASDYVSAVADLIRPFIPAGRCYAALGTDGFGRSDTRPALRAYFGVDAQHIAAEALRRIAQNPDG